LVFYLTTNFACWLLFEGYPKTAEGLGACYVAALPFYRWMPVGDLAWAVGLTACAAAALRAVTGESVVASSQGGTVSG